MHTGRFSISPGSGVSTEKKKKKTRSGASIAWALVNFSGQNKILFWPLKLIPAQMLNAMIVNASLDVSFSQASGIFSAQILLLLDALAVFFFSDSKLLCVHGHIS